MTPPVELDEDVSRGEQLAHPLRESEHRHAWLGGERVLETPTRVHVAPGEADHGRVHVLQRPAGCALEIAHTPAAARHEHHAAVGRQAERVQGFGAVVRNEELGADRRCHGFGAPTARNPLDRRDERGVHDDVEVDPAIGPQLEPGEVGDRRADGAAHLAAQAEAAEDHRRHRPRRDDDVRVCGPRDAQDRTRSRQRQQPPCDRPQGATAPQASEEEREEPWGPAELPAVGVAEEPGERARQLLERVHDGDRGVRP